jgi:hypothetical protein
MNTVPWRPLPCDRPGCPCTHTAGCEAGWIEHKLHKHGRWHEAVRPCPICRPGRAATGDETHGDAGHTKWLARLRQANAKSARTKADDW